MKSKVVNGKRLWYLANGSLVKRSQHPNHMEKRKQRYLAGKEKENAQFKKWYADPKNRKRKLETGTYCGDLIIWIESVEPILPTLIQNMAT